MEEVACVMDIQVQTGRQVNGEISLRTRSSGSKGMEAKHPRSIRERISELGP